MVELGLGVRFVEFYFRSFILTLVFLLRYIIGFFGNLFFLGFCYFIWSNFWEKETEFMVCIFFL